MDVHDGLGPEHTDGTQTMWEPPGYDAGDTGSTDPSGYDGYDAGSGSDSAGGGYDDSTGSGDTGGGAEDGSGAGTDTGSGAGTMTVEVDGETRELPAEKDYTGDGKADAVVETPDGKVIVFADTEDNATGDAGPDGKADEAYIVDKSTGKVVGAAHIDPSSGSWVEGTDSSGPSAVGGGGGTGGTGGTGETGGGEEVKTSAAGWLYDHGYGLENYDYLTLLLPDVLYLHSELLGAWVTAGVLAVPFWLLALVLLWRALLRAMAARRLAESFLLVIAVWHVFFSPIGDITRVHLAVMLGLALSVLARPGPDGAEPGGEQHAEPGGDGDLAGRAADRPA